jgi:hypothetical protein
LRRQGRVSFLTPQLDLELPELSPGVCLERETDVLPTWSDGNDSAWKDNGKDKDKDNHSHNHSDSDTCMDNHNDTENGNDDNNDFQGLGRTRSA